MQSLSNVSSTLFGLVFLLFFSCTSDLSNQAEPTGEDNLAYQWGQVALDATAFDTDRFNPRPTITSRYLGLIFTAIFDAWSVYDPRATPVFLEGVEKAPQEEMTLENKEVAISYAAYEALSEYFYSDTAYFREFMEDELGLDPDVEVDDPRDPVAIGRKAAQTVIEKRKGDGSNQYAMEEGSEGVPYYNYIGYQPVNNPDTNVDINRWQPKYFLDEEGEPFAPSCLTPYWQLVEPIAMDSASQFRSPPPPYVGEEQLEKEVAEVVEMQANLTNEEKALVEFMRDGPHSVQQAGHWLTFAQDVSRRDQHTLDEDVKMYFLVEVAAMDGFIASWDTKMYYDFARPFALVHEYFEGDTIYGWIGEEEGWGEMLGEDWRPYSPSNFLCPPFPSYVSGHSTISGACAEALKLYKEADTFGVSVDLVPGIMTEPNNLGDTVTLFFPTFTEAAEMAGVSRVLGGYHIQADNIEGLELGRKVGQKAYEFYRDHVGEEPKL